MRRRSFLGTGLTAGAALLAGVPAARAQLGLERLDLGGLPTPITSHPELANRLGLASLHVKRDDRAGATYGGSKARKLELLLAEARRAGRTSVLTFGGVASNHALATAVHGCALGLRCHLVLLPEPASSRARRHMLAAHRLGAVLHAGTRADRDEPDRAVARFCSGDDPYVIPMGGTSALGNVGYFEAARELRAQIDSGEVPPPHTIFVAAGTTGTVSGLALGVPSFSIGSRIVAVRVSGRRTANRSRIRHEVARTRALLTRHRIASSPELGDVALEDGFVAPGYARPSAAGRAAISLAAELGIELDSTYTAKAFAALIAHAPRLAGRHVLFWNTFDPREVSIGEATVGDLPASLRGYAR